MAVAIVERSDIVHVEKHERDPLLTSPHGKRENELPVRRESAHTIHGSIVGAYRATTLLAASVRE
jgi:hypothetical protein